jgi:hypothetical protein
MSQVQTKMPAGSTMRMPLTGWTGLRAALKPARAGSKPEMIASSARAWTRSSRAPLENGG